LGPVFQLVIAGVFYFILASIVGIALLSLAKTITYFKRKRDISVSPLFWFPIKLAPYFLLAIIGNALICEFVRDVDPPLTDYWSLPINGELALGAIDIPDKWYLWPSREGGESIISDIVLVGISENALYGSTELDGYFIYLLSSNKKNTHLTKKDFESAILKIEGNIPKLQHPSDYYYDKRDFGDFFTLLLIFIYPLFRFYKVCIAFYNSIVTSNNESVSTAT